MIALNKQEPEIELKIGKIYDYFDDGKIRESRRSTVILTDIIPFNKINKKILSRWKREVKECYWLYSPKTDYFLIGVLQDSSKEEVIFVRTVNNEWFSLGFLTAGLLKEPEFWLDYCKDLKK